MAEDVWTVWFAILLRNITLLELTVTVCYVFVHSFRVLTVNHIRSTFRANPSVCQPLDIRDVHDVTHHTFCEHQCGECWPKRFIKPLLLDVIQPLFFVVVVDVDVDVIHLGRLFHLFHRHSLERIDYRLSCFGWSRWVCDSMVLTEELSCCLGSMNDRVLLCIR